MAISCNPVDLVAAAKCFQCADGALGEAMSVYLTCQWAQGGMPVAGPYIAGEGTGEMILGEGGERILPEDA